MAPLGRAQLRQGRARAVDARVARHRARALPRRAGGHRVSEPALDTAQRALAAVRDADGAQATVIAERSLVLRFARSRPTQSTAVDDITVEVTVLRDGHLGSATTNSTDGESLDQCARAAQAAAEVTARR